MQFSCPEQATAVTVQAKQQIPILPQQTKQSGITMAEALGLITHYCSVDVPTQLQQRRVIDTLPSKIRNSDPQQEDIRQELTNRWLEQKDYHNRSVRELPPLISGQRALYKDQQSGCWAPATVVT